MKTPRDEAELLRAARALAGRTVGELAAEHGVALPPSPTRGKGFVGSLVERALGARAGSTSGPDFAELGVELKTVPMDARGRVLESTFVATLPLTAMDLRDYADSPVGRKLARVLFVPVEGRPIALGARRIGTPVLYVPSDTDRHIFATDYENFAERIGRGEVSSLRAHAGVALQVRPKGRNAASRRLAVDDSGTIARVPGRGIYLRARFTEALLRRAREATPCGSEGPVLQE